MSDYHVSDSPTFLFIFHLKDIFKNAVSQNDNCPDDLRNDLLKKVRFYLENKKNNFKKI